ncbi:hypothetical protein CHS0354_039337 [Potamilus streckersoni]|uniref:Uncharacterized protein n=1 Tax=Potamilus streckersoni TaxID=2493646 RepID=A0AAE0T367_9BIVA|nr:hypothetical protein CHS0354_039337 [Potamilus streckersoni]
MNGRDYADYVKEQLGDCLANAIVDLLYKLPADPIEHLAFWLYKYRKKEPPVKYETVMKKVTSHLRMQKQEGVAGKDCFGIQILSNATYKETAEKFNVSTVKNQTVHERDCDVFSTIGDIFDEEDVV